MASQDDPTTTTETADTGHQGPTAYAADQAATPDEAPAKPARKRASRKRAVAPASSGSVTDTEAGPAEAGGVEADAVVAPRTRRRSTKTTEPTKTTEAPVEGDQGDRPVAETPAADDTVDGEADAAPARTSRTKAAKKASKKTSKKSGKKAGKEPAAAQGTGPSGDERTSGTAAAETDRSAGAGFGLLFQAPDLTTAPSRRRASRPAAAPAAAPETAGDDTSPAGEAVDAASATADTSEDIEEQTGRRRRRRGGKGRRGRTTEADASTETPEGPAEASSTGPAEAEQGEDDTEGAGSRRRRRRRRAGAEGGESDDPPGTVTRVREPRARDLVSGVKGSTRLEAKKQRRREGREAGRRRTIITEAEFLARRESVDRVMVVREKDSRTQIAVLEDGVLVEHYVSRETNASMAGNIYLGRVQNVLPSMEAAFVDVGKGRNAVLYAGEVNWDAAGLEGNAPKRIENALKSGDSVLVQVTKDPIGHKGARLTSQISLPGRYLVYVPEGSMTGISRKLPDTERSRLKGILKEVVPGSAGVIVRTAAEGASEEELRADVDRLTKTWEAISTKAATAATRKGSGGAPLLVHGEPDLTVRVIRDIFNEDFSSLVVAGDGAWEQVRSYVQDVAPDLAERVTKWTSEVDVFTDQRVHEQLAKAMDRKVWLPSGGSLVIDRTEAMTVVDVNTGKFVGSGGNLEETVTKNNIEAAEEIVRQLRLRDIGGIIVIDFIDMVLESNRDLVVRRLLECLGRDRTKHQVAEVTSLGLVQMTRKRVGSGLIEVFSEPCDRCNGRGIIVHSEPVEKSSDNGHDHGQDHGNGNGNGRHGAPPTRRGRGGEPARPEPAQAPVHHGPTAAQIAATAHAAAMKVAMFAPADLGTTPDTPVEVVPESDGADQGTPSPLHAAATEPATVRAAAVEPVDDEPAPDLVDRLLGTDLPDAVIAAESTAYEPPPRTVLARPRRKRGRVVAPAGPPRHPEPEAAPAGDAG